MGSALVDVIFGVIKGKSRELMDEDQISVELVVGISLLIIEDFDLESLFVQKLGREMGMTEAHALVSTRGLPLYIFLIFLGFVLIPVAFC